MSGDGNAKYPKPKRPQTRLGLPDLDHSKSAVLDSLRSPESKRGYRHAIDEFIQGRWLAQSGARRWYSTCEKKQAGISAGI
jgi:hypothetical protein